MPLPFKPKKPFQPSLGMPFRDANGQTIAWILPKANWHGELAQELADAVNCCDGLNPKMIPELIKTLQAVKDLLISSRSAKYKRTALRIKSVLRRAERNMK